MNSTLTAEDYNSFWVYLYFGVHTPGISHCIERAYLDFNRTIHGIGTCGRRDEVKTQTRHYLGHLFSSLSTLENAPSSSPLFDEWHREACETLCGIYRTHGYNDFRLGQAQKWINMTFKYIFALGEERIPGFASLYSFCHVPIDNVMIKALKKYNAPKLDRAWSRVDDYAEYLSYQRWIRGTFEEAPLDVEFKLWMGHEVKTKNSFLMEQGSATTSVYGA